MACGLGKLDQIKFLPRDFCRATIGLKPFARRAVFSKLRCIDLSSCDPLAFQGWEELIVRLREVKIKQSKACDGPFHFGLN